MTITLDKKTMGIITIVISILGLFGGNHLYTNYGNGDGTIMNNKIIQIVDAEINGHRAELIPHIGLANTDETYKENIKEIHKILDVMREDIFIIKLAICSHNDFDCSRMN